MLTGRDFWHLIEHIMPVYVIVLLGYLFYRYKIILPVHMPGISRWISVLGVPSYVFHLLAFNDPYNINLKLVGADALQKMVALMIGCLWWKFATRGCIEHLISFFMLATLPNTVLIGQALLEPLYGNVVDGNVITIIFLQCLLWYNLTISIYELRTVLIEMNETKQQPGLPATLSGLQLEGISSRKSVSIVIVDNSLGDSRSSHDFTFPLEDVDGRSSFASSRVSFSRVVPVTSAFKEDDGFMVGNVSRGDVQSPRISTRLVGSEGTKLAEPRTDVEQDAQDARVEVLDTSATQEEANAPRPQPDGLGFVWVVLVKVLHKLKYSQLTYASIAGFTYSLLAFKFHWTMPYYVRTSLEFISQGSLGLIIFIIGVSWAKSNKLISCGLKVLTIGIVIRFLVGPLIMIVSSLAVGLKGNNFQLAVLQAVIPQGVISFVLAKEYNLDIEVFSTAVIFQLVIFLPFVICYYFILDSI